MKITAVHTAVVEGNYDWTYVRIDTDTDGLSGLGEAYFFAWQRVLGAASQFAGKSAGMR
jgi:L-alanine-DL-glutamate epimerase-like enolase superfamily enzyme